MQSLSKLVCLSFTNIYYKFLNLSKILHQLLILSLNILIISLKIIDNLLSSFLPYVKKWIMDGKSTK